MKKISTDPENFFETIDQYLSANTKEISSSGLEEIISKVRSKTGLEEDIATEIVKSFFEETRSAMLRSDMVSFPGFGKFYIANPGNKTSKKRIFCKFAPFKQYIKSINGK